MQQHRTHQCCLLVLNRTRNWMAMGGTPQLSWHRRCQQLSLHVRPAMRRLARDVRQQLVPVIDVSPFFSSHASSSAEDDIVESVRRACKDVGFMVVVGHGSHLLLLEGSLVKLLELTCPSQVL